jgi:hypothetical protein
VSLGAIVESIDDAVAVLIACIRSTDFLTQRGARERHEVIDVAVQNRQEDFSGREHVASSCPASAIPVPSRARLLSAESGTSPDVARVSCCRIVVAFAAL